MRLESARGWLDIAASVLEFEAASPPHADIARGHHLSFEKS
jgi:hypothetical protein